MRRIIGLFLKLFPLGVAAAIAVAVVAGLATDATSMKVKASGFSNVDGPVSHGWYVQVLGTFGKRHAVTHQIADPLEIDYRARTPVEEVVPSWAGEASVDRLYVGELSRRIDIACGWPMPMLRGRVEFDRRVRVDETHAFLLSVGGNAPVYGYQVRGVPLRPIWIGFIVNSLVWTVILAGAVLFGSWAWRVRCHRKNVCFRCRYDLRGGPHERCPECGVVT